MTNAERAELLPSAQVEAKDHRFLGLLSTALRRIPEGTPPIRTVERLRLKAKARSGTLAGLTTYSPPEHGGWRETGYSPGEGHQTITFYSEKLDQLSDSGALAVVAHELAHAWLNEHVHPEESKSRERETDELARKWGFAQELEALDEEAFSV